MCDVNPLGPMMHLKEIERQALALRLEALNSRPGICAAASARVMKLLKRLSLSLGIMSAGGSANFGKR